jgi:hypothetical protein
LHIAGRTRPAGPNLVLPKAAAQVPLSRLLQRLA